MTKADSVFIAPGAVVIGDVRLGENVSVWFNAVIRADNRTICIGRNTNIQDNCTLHLDPGGHLEIGENVTVGHNAIVHGCTVGDNTLIGMGAIVMNHAVIGKNCIIGAAALVTEGKVIPDNSLVIGCPAKITRRVTEEEIAHITYNASVYVQEGQHYKEMLEKGSI